jgi:rhamnulokinase
MDTKEKKVSVAFDCGNSSFRIVVGLYDGEKINMDVIAQVQNSAIQINSLFYWDILHIFDGLKQGLKMAYQKYGHIDSIGICTWGIDFGLLDKNGYLLSNPLSYRNSFSERELSALSADEKRQMFELSGIQNNRINSLYQLLGIKRLMPELFSLARHFLLTPDLLVYMFTGQMSTEFSITSTTQLLDVKTGQYSDAILSKFGLPPAMFKKLKHHGEVLGYLSDSIAAELGINVCPVICVPSHDTACAVTAVPTMQDDFLFISSGTWSLIGTELKEPIIDQRVYERNFANEGGAFGTITLLKNSTGMHILQGLKNQLESDGHPYSWDSIVKIAQGYNGKICIFNPNATELFNPKNMIKAVKELMGETNDDIGQLFTSVYYSLAYSYMHAVEQIQEITGKDYKNIYIVGGGSQNEYLNQLIADVTGKTVIAGPKEATSLGNVAIQLKYHHKDFTLNDVRKTIQASENLRLFNSRVDRNIQELNNRYSIFKNKLNLMPN